jgi:hypothetical protein
VAPEELELGGEVARARTAWGETEALCGPISKEKGKRNNGGGEESAHMIRSACTGPWPGMSAAVHRPLISQQPGPPGGRGGGGGGWGFYMKTKKKILI